MIDMLDALFAAFARLMVALGIPFPDLSERLKSHYVAAARDLADGKVTDSKLSVMTGLQRRDIVRLKDIERPEPRQTHLSRLVALWCTDPAYARAPLPRTGPAPSFEALAWEVRRDVHPRSLLDALVLAGTVRIEGEHVHLLTESYQPLAGSEDQMAYLARNIGDHLSAAIANVTSPQPPFFERAAHYSDLTEDQVKTLENLFRNKQMALLSEISATAEKMKSQPGGAGQHRLRAGGYIYFEESQT